MKPTDISAPTAIPPTVEKTALITPHPRMNRTKKKISAEAVKARLE